MEGNVLFKIHSSIFYLLLYSDLNPLTVCQARFWKILETLNIFKNIDKKTLLEYWKDAQTKITILRYWL